MSNAGAAAIAASCRRLRSLCLKGCSVDDSAVLIEIVSRNPGLAMLSLSGVKGATDEVISCVARECGDIREIYLSGVPVSSEAVSRFRHLVGHGVQVYGKRLKAKKVP